LAPPLLAPAVLVGALPRAFSGTAVKPPCLLEKRSAGGAFGLLASAGCAVTPAITFALLAQLIPIEARNAQFLADLLARLALAQLPVPPAITLALLPEPIFVFAGEPQLLALASTSTGPTIIHADAAGSDLNRRLRLRTGREETTAGGEDEYEGNRCGSNGFHECSLFVVDSNNVARGADAFSLRSLAIGCASTRVDHA